MEFNPLASQRTRITTTAATSGHTTRDGTEDFSAQVWHLSLAADLSTIRRPFNIRLHKQEWKVVSEGLIVLLFHNRYGGEHA